VHGATGFGHGDRELSSQLNADRGRGVRKPAPPPVRFGTHAPALEP
jgi:hypothetical protein